MKMRSMLRRLTDRRTRARWLTRFMAARAIHQDSIETWLDRYPLLFDACRTMLKGREHLRLLSFGCSSGEEVLSLRHYFPRAVIVGAELNRGELATCHARAPVPDVFFVHSKRRRIAAHGPYDAVFCMAVLQRRPHAVERSGLTSIARHYPFDRFDDQVSFLTGQLRSGGLLIVEHAQYRIEDSGAAGQLEPVASAGQWVAAGPRFDRNGKIIPPPVSISRIFRKIS